MRSRSIRACVSAAGLPKSLPNSAHRSPSVVAGRSPCLFRKISTSSYGLPLLKLLRKTSSCSGAMSTSLIIALGDLFHEWNIVTSPLNTSGWHFGRFCFANVATSCRLEVVNVSRETLEYNPLRVTSPEVG